MSKKKTRLMRVPDNFYKNIKKMSEDRGTDMVNMLEQSTPILENANYLSDLIGLRLHKKKKRR